MFISQGGGRKRRRVQYATKYTVILWRNVSRERTMGQEDENIINVQTKHDSSELRRNIHSFSNIMAALLLTLLVDIPPATSEVN